ncbi:uncharacterized protein LOC143785694 [Ranitomeya variabilis]|uniref:uncharacterized protein LOC143785694 n=1 Tax=Ranitomeya variabilis TaxID=490064 RepID=UPI00405625F0
MWTGPSSSVGSVDITPEEAFRRLAFCMKFLPSPLYKMERLMPTSPEAQKKYTTRHEYEEQPAPSMKTHITEQEARAMRAKVLCMDLDEEQLTQKEERKKKKVNITIKIGAGRETPTEARRSGRTEARRSGRTEARRSGRTEARRSSRTTQCHILQYINQYLRGKKNIIWTILLGPLSR